MNKILSSSLLLVMILLGMNRLSAQQSAIFHDPDQDLKEGLELFSRAQYGAAQERLSQYLDRTAGSEATSRSDAAFYHAMCAIYLDHQNAEDLVNQFIDQFPESSKAHQARFEMGKYLFQDEKYRRSMRWLQQVELKKLDKSLRQECQFKLAYGYFEEKDYKKAQNIFYTLLNQEGPYKDDITYYYSYTHYLDKNYETALQGFLELTDNRKYGGIVSYYIAQIYYQQEKYEEVIDFASQLLRRANQEQQTEIARIIGNSYFRLNKYAEAIPYLEEYRAGVKRIDREEHYALGYAYYKNNQLQDAVQELEQVGDTEDPLTQNANHLLGGILVDLDDKMKARSAFRKAANLSFNKELQEESLLNYAKLNFDLSISGETLRAFEEFLKTFPNSQHTDQVYNYLVKVFMNTRNYQEALVTMDKIKDKNSDINTAYQRIAYYRGLELFNNLKYRDAINMLAKSLESGNYNPTIKSLCYYWTGEVWYHLKGYDQAIKAYNDFLYSSGAYNLPEYDLAHYSLGYCYFNKDNYDQSMSWFRKFVNRASSHEQDPLVADAYNRIGDCYFMNRAYWQAIEYYDKAIGLRTENADYGLFQKGFSFGLLQRTDRKIEVLKQLIDDFPKSAYVDDALFEIGRSWVILDNRFEAISVFKDLIKKFPNSSYTRKSYLQLGLVYYNGDQSDEALKMYKKVVSSWPDTQEGKDALVGLKNVYIDQNRVDEYFAYLRTIGRGNNVSVSEQDSLLYMAAENLYMQGDCDLAKENFINYIKRFPSGSFLLNANFYKADCNYRASELDEALASYEYVLSRGANDFTEVALARVGYIYFEKGNYAKAMSLYQQLDRQAEMPANKLDARIGIMRCNYITRDYQATTEAANKVLLTDKITDDIIREASYKLAKSYYALGDKENALDVFSVVAQDVKNVEGAEAKYLKADILFNKGMVDQAEKEILQFLDQNTTHQYWLAKAYILWSDIYVSRKDYFQAKSTLQILSETYANRSDGIIDTVNEKIRWIDNQTQEK